MTAVIGLLNKRGVAIAADSAVTRTADIGNKYTKNGSKMLRISNIEPISVMITGNGRFLYNPWEVVVRRYRQVRGNIKHRTVEICAHDFFDYISKSKEFWDDDYMLHFNNILDKVFKSANSSLSGEFSAGYVVEPEKYSKSFVKELKRIQKKYSKQEKCSHFQDYSIEQFRTCASSIIDSYFDRVTNGEIEEFETSFPKGFLDSVREPLEETVMEMMTNCSDSMSNCSTLIFSGFGEKQVYPSLVPALVCGGFDHRVNYKIKIEDIVCINDEKPVAICPFAQRDVIDSLIRGENISCLNHIMDLTRSQYQNVAEKIFSQKYNEQDEKFLDMLKQVDYEDLVCRYERNIRRLLDKNQKEWEKKLEHYDLKAMAALAESLIDLTGFQRILTFQQEEVGGPIDVAVITKNEGFVWLNRKSWYHHKDLNGMYGSLGI